MTMTRTLLAATFVLSLATAACGKSKVEQCNAFIDRANAAQTVMTGLHFDSEDPKKLEAEATKVDGEAKALKAVELKDEKLAKFRDDYASNLTKLAGNVRDIAKLQTDAKNPGKSAGLETQLKKLETDAEKIEKDESKLVDDINTYCTGSK